MGDLVVEVLLVPDCPHRDPALGVAREALTMAGLGGAEVRVTVIAEDEEAARVGFVGSPSFFVDGRDLLPASAPAAVACRVYLRAAGGRGGVPDVAVLAAALRERAAGRAPAG